MIRDVGRVLDMPYADVDRIAKQIPPALDMTLERAVTENAVLREMRDKDPRVKDVLEMGKRLEGMSRNAGVHAAGVVIAPGPINDYAPLFKSNRDEITTQWAMKEVERVGLLKMDFLGLRTLTVIDDALAEIKRTEDVDARPRRGPARRPGHLSAVLRRPDLRHLPVRELGHARAAAQVQAAAARRPHRLQRALPAGPAQERHGRRLHRPQAGQDRGQVRPGGARADPGRHLRRHRLPGTGDADRGRARRLHPRPGRRAAQGDGQEEPQGHGQAARGLPRRARRRRASARRRPRRSST